MFKRLLQPLLHLAFLFTRPLTVGVRGICYNPQTNCILLVKHTYSEGWALPGGGVEVGESMLRALEREAREEAGLTFKTARILDAFYNSSISSRDHVILYILEDCLRESDHKLPTLEISESGWFKLDSLPKLLTPCAAAAIEHIVARNQK